MTIHIVLNIFHDDFEEFIELVGGEAFDVFGAGIEVASDVDDETMRKIFLPQRFFSLDEEDIG